MGRRERSDLDMIASRLARDAEAVCRHFLPEGRRCGSYWVVGDVRGSPGQSMFVRLKDAGGRRAGRWMDAATGEHGDLFDVIRESVGLSGFGETLDAVRRFLVLPRERMADHSDRLGSSHTGSPEASRKLFAGSRSILGTAAQLYLANRAITDLTGLDSLRFHPRCYYRPHGAITEKWPAMIAAVTDAVGTIVGLHRTYLARPVGPLSPDFGKAPIETPRRAMGALFGNAVRFGRASELLLAGEGIETVLSLRSAMPSMPMAAALSAGHLGVLSLPQSLRRLYVARENDAESAAAWSRLNERCRGSGIDLIGLQPALNDHNDDLRLVGHDALRSSLALQLDPEDVSRFLA